MASSLQVAKRQLRKKIKAALQNLSQDDVAGQSSKVLQTLHLMPEYQRARRIGVYLSMPLGEISTKDIVHDAFRKGKRVFVPYIYKVTGSPPDGLTSVMDMLELQSIQDLESLRPDKWGIPTLRNDTLDNRENCFGSKGTTKGHILQCKVGHELDVILMPGMAFDKDLHRLGHGKGFYDQFLERYHAGIRKNPELNMPFLIGLALSEQLLSQTESVPVDESDWPLDALLVGDGQRLEAKGSLI